MLALARLYVIFSEQRERKQALKLLRKVENIVAEVSVRLMHLENQAEDFAANEEEDDESAQAASDASLNSCTWL